MGTPTCTVEASALGDPAGFDIVINAMSLGVNGDDPLPVDVFVRFQSGSVGTITEDASSSSRTRCTASGYRDRKVPTRPAGSHRSAWG